MNTHNKCMLAMALASAMAYSTTAAAQSAFPNRPDAVEAASKSVDVADRMHEDARQAAERAETYAELADRYGSGVAVQIAEQAAERAETYARFAREYEDDARGQKSVARHGYPPSRAANRSIDSAVEATAARNAAVKAADTAKRAATRAVANNAAPPVVVPITVDTVRVHTDPYAAAFVRLDTDRNGMLSAAEISNDTTFSQRFGLIDTDKDRMLSPREVGYWVGSMPMGGRQVVTINGSQRGSATLAVPSDRATFGLNFKTLDRNRDGMLTGAEIESQWEPADRNVDGQISEFEFASWVKDGPQGVANRAIGEGFDRFDRNRDRMLSQSEIASVPMLRDHFATLDRNRDRMLDRNELMAADRATFGLNFKMLDRNRDGMLTGAEIESQWEPADRNVDGQISEFEFSSWVNNGVAGAANRAIGENFDMLDANRDRIVTMDEAARLPALQSEFAYADRNKNGQLAEWEFDTWLELTGRTAAR